MTMIDGVVRFDRGECLSLDIEGLAERIETIQQKLRSGSDA